MKLNFVLLTPGKNEGKVVPVPRFPFLVGRDPQCHLRPACPLISHHHCAVDIHDNKAFVCDLHSTNGTFVNDQRIQDEVELHHQDRLRIGPLAFTVRLVAGTPVSRATPSSPTREVRKEDALEDLVATLLLVMPDEEKPAPDNLKLVSGGIPTDSTVPDLRRPEGATTGKARSQVANTTEASKAILEKYRWRARA